MKVGIFKIGKIGLTETFVRSNVDRLPFFSLFIGHLPIPHIGNDNPGFLTMILTYAGKIASKISFELQDRINSFIYYRILSQVKPDVVLAQYGHAGAIISSPCRLKKIPLVIYFRGYDATNKTHLEEYADLYKVMFQTCDATVSVSRSIRTHVIALGADPNTAFVNPSGADIEAFSINKELAKEKRLLFVGRFVEKKAPQLTLLAYSRIKEKHPDSRLVMIGDGPLLGACKDLAEALDLKEQVEFLGSQSHEDVQRQMQKARVYVQHSVVASNGDSEGTPVAIMEAGASGVPVVATRHAGIPDAVIHGKTGYLVDERDVKSMAKYMDELLADYDTASQMGNNARDHIMKNFSQKDSIRRLAKILQWATDKRETKPTLFPDWSHIALDKENGENE